VAFDGAFLRFCCVFEGGSPKMCEFVMVKSWWNRGECVANVEH